MRREGSAFAGLGVVMLKELSDHLTGIRMIIMEWIVVLMAVGVVFTGIQQMRSPRRIRFCSSACSPGPGMVCRHSWPYVLPRAARGDRNWL